MTKTCRLGPVAAFGVITLLAFVPLAGHDGSEPIGLSLFFQNGVMAPIALVGDRPRYVQEIDIVATTPPSGVDAGIDPLINSSEFATLDWSGVAMVEEDWRSPDGVTFMRQRFYRGAAWMDKESVFKVTPLDGAGDAVGPPLVVSAGRDDDWKDADDAFVRRFNARQIALGCPAVNDCTGATFIAQGLVQVRNALHAEDSARRIPSQATGLALNWNRDDGADRTVAVSRVDPSSLPYGYGFGISLELITNPGPDGYFSPGDSVTFRVTFTDGDGNRLHPVGSLPTYGQFVRGEIASGLRYFDGFSLSPTTYYALKHRESNVLVTLSGPTDRYKTPTVPIGPAQFFVPQATVATVAADGYTAVAQGLPPFAITFLPPLWDTPLTDLVTFEVPADAEPGTYVAGLKARRDFGGEALNRGTTMEIQVGTTTPTTFSPATGQCQSCHTGPSQLGMVLHGISDRRACFSCHAPIVFEPDAALDIRAHMVHDRSNRFPANMETCSTCHLTTPSGPARGLLP